MATLESVLFETRVFPPDEAFVRRANVAGRAAYDALWARVRADEPGFWAELARAQIDWTKPFTRVLDESNPPFYRWFDDGELNVSANCLDRHLSTRADKTALIFEADDGQVTRVSYRELHARVCRFANGLQALRMKKGERAVIYLPMSVEAVVAMLACARLGVIHSVVFGGFSAKSLAERITDTGARLVITADQGLRGGKAVSLKAAVDEALRLAAGHAVESVVVYRRTGAQVAWEPSRDVEWESLTADLPDTCPPVPVEAEHPLFILYTSGSTGRPKGVQHASAGYLLGAVLSMRWVFDYHDSDVFWCTADVGWVTGHSYVVYGPLALGATVVIFEGVPTYPDAGRFWQMIERHRVTVFYTAPTAIRSLIKLGADLPRRHDLSSLRLLGSVGEPINPGAWMWYYETVGGGRCPVVDTWWQTETGSHMIAPVPGAVAAKPGSCTLPLPGIAADVVDELGGPVAPGQGGLLVIRRPFPSLARTLWNDPERFRQTYFPEELGGRIYLAGDSAHRDADGYFWIMGRVDDVLNVSGHRLGTMEIESALVAHPKVAEAAVVGRPHEVKGEAVVAFVVLRGERPQGAEAETMARELREWVAKEIGAIAKPEELRFGDNLPKTRSGKIMRRLLRAVARGEAISQDVSTLENPAILEQFGARPA